MIIICFIARFAYFSFFEHLFCQIRIIKIINVNVQTVRPSDTEEIYSIVSSETVHCEKYSCVRLTHYCWHNYIKCWFCYCFCFINPENVNISKPFNIDFSLFSETFEDNCRAGCFMYNLFIFNCIIKVEFIY